MGSEGRENEGADSQEKGEALGDRPISASVMDHEGSSGGNSRNADQKASEKLARILGDTPETKIPTSVDTQREVSASTVGRMMGLATTLDLKLIEGKLDLLSSRLNNLTVRMEKVLSVLSQSPTGSDMERLDVQIGSLKSLMKELLMPGVQDSGQQGKEGSVADSKGVGSKTSPSKDRDSAQGGPGTDNK